MIFSKNLENDHQVALWTAPPRTGWSGYATGGDGGHPQGEKVENFFVRFFQKNT